MSFRSDQFTEDNKKRSCNISENVAAAYNSPDEDYPLVNSRAEINIDEIGCLDNENE